MRWTRRRRPGPSLPPITWSTSCPTAPPPSGSSTRPASPPSNRGVVFYNIGRGTTVAEDALRAALTDGRVAAAYLDVTSTEPLPPENPLWSAPNCFITPHTGGGHATESVRLVRHFLANLTRFAAGEPLLDRVV